MVGLDRVKQQFNTLINRAKIDEARKERGEPVPDRTMHLVFAGPPGTGKTTAAKLIAEAYSAIGLVKKKEPVEISGRDLVNPYEGGTATQVTEIFDRAKNGVLFIDEAYSMVNGHQDTPGLEALNQFLKLAEDRRDNTVVILAGYGGGDGGEDVVEYLNQFNKGMSSRFPTRIPFDSYNAQELAQVGESMLGEHSKFADDAAKKAFKRAAKIAGGSKDNPLNARGVRSLVELIWNAQSDRLVREGGYRNRSKDLSTITVEDIKSGLDGLAV